MYDKGKIISGLVIFVALVLLPFWWQAGSAGVKPDPQLPKAEKTCVMSKEMMRTEHMQILNQWRDDVVRDADRLYVADNGKKFEMSLSNGCMRCHNDKEKFCDQCHNYLGVNPYCWDCHLTPAQKEGK
ncbi:sulfate reduction electron transfer complex DsrMKJOP subunit DsrJ [Dethiosulfatarculus sandiegensis]|uniref:Cytochrome C n=1 Tax=Dethiosulfatarculus sandiegensis TaxID=1429043 RepID=A0A0D2HSH3_9BACT|nr:sulfate reduction electron transfer complex DsrMKJOP subunit DsrJ [Dethiosulfatarculus sandiegensis]KIX13463.1 cytochrome C [Dethiosulfatarculus sandiegensis]